jgi:hypothetical protein
MGTPPLPDRSDQESEADGEHPIFPQGKVKAGLKVFPEAHRTGEKTAKWQSGHLTARLRSRHLDRATNVEGRPCRGGLSN